MMMYSQCMEASLLCVPVRDAWVKTSDMDLTFAVDVCCCGNINQLEFSESLDGPDLSSRWTFLLGFYVLFFSSSNAVRLPPPRPRCSARTNNRRLRVKYAIHN